MPTIDQTLSTELEIV